MHQTRERKLARAPRALLFRRSSDPVRPEEVRMTRCRPNALLAAVLVLGTASATNANAQTAAVVGVARAEDGGAPIPFALVRLVPADSTASPSRTPPQGITSDNGRYRFEGVSAGQYRVQLLRIGFRPVLSDPVQVAAGEPVQLALRVASQPLELPPVNRHG